MANKQTHAKRSGYSSHQGAPYSMFEQRARTKKAKKEIARERAASMGKFMELLSRVKGEKHE